MLNIKKIHVGMLALGLGFALIAHADEVKIVSGGALSADIHLTNPAIKLTPDKSELLYLNTEAASVMVGNPNHLSIVAESSKTLVLIPKAPGASHFTVLDQKGHVILQRHVIVASPKKDYLRIRRTCASGNENCETTSMYYCPGMCYEIAMNDGMDNAARGSDEIKQSNQSAYALSPPQADNEE